VPPYIVPRERVENRRTVRAVDLKMSLQECTPRIQIKSDDRSERRGLMDIMHTFEVNECKRSETGKNYAPQVYIDGIADGRSIQFWFAPRPGVSHEQLDALIKQMRDVLGSCHLQITDDPWAKTRAAGR
jgi:hypothetical protein